MAEPPGRRTEWTLATVTVLGFIAQLLPVAYPDEPWLQTSARVALALSLGALLGLGVVVLIRRRRRSIEARGASTLPALKSSGTAVTGGGGFSVRGTVDHTWVSTRSVRTRWWGSIGNGVPGPAFGRARYASRGLRRARAR